MKPARTVGCTLTVTNGGANTIVKVVAADQVPGGTFLSSSSSLCTGLNTDTLTCNIGTLASGSTFGPVTFELQVPSTGSSFGLQFDGTFDPEPLRNPNKRGSDTFKSNTVTTQLDPSADFDGTFVNVAGDTVQTGGAISGDNPYSTTGTVLGAQAFAAGLSVREEAAGSGNENCPNTGCFGDQVIQFNITPLGDADFPASFTLSWTISGHVIDRATKADDIVVTHDGIVAPLCADTDPAIEACIVSKTIDPSTNNATIKAEGPGDGNGGWGSG